MNWKSYGRGCKRFGKEMSIPFFLSAAWSIYSFFDAPPEKRSVISTLTIFCSGFFFFSWLPAQFNRVFKQQRVEDDLGAIQTNINKMLIRLEQRTEHLVSHVTGGDSFCYFEPMYPGGRVFLNIKGEYSVYDLSVRIVDIDLLLESQNSGSFETSFKVGDVAPGFIRPLPNILPMGRHKDKPRFNIFLIARNGYFVQLLRFVATGETYQIATKVYKVDAGGNLVANLYEYISDQYPRNNEGLIDWS